MTTTSTGRSRRCPGIGPWTSTVYLLMVLLRPDLWPVGDIALAQAVGDVKGLGRRPDPLEMDRARRGLATMALGRGAALLARLPVTPRPGRIGRRPGSGVRSGLAQEPAPVTSPTDLPPNVRRLVDEIESEIGETDVDVDDISGSRGDHRAGEASRATAGSRPRCARS